MLQKSVTVRNAQLDALEIAIGPSPRLKLFSGAEPANCAAADPAGLLATMVLPADWMQAASSGQKALAGTWAASATAAGNVASYRIYDSGVTACHLQGSVSSIVAGTGDLLLDNVNLEIGQTATVVSYTLTANNA